METPRIAILIPAFNEEGTIGAVIEGALMFGDVFVSDDGSTDSTSQFSKAHGAMVLTQGSNYGYSSALSFGLSVIIAEGYQLIVTIDADGQHDPADIGHFISHLIADSDIVVGRRPTCARLMERVFGLLTATLSSVSDPLCGMKGFRAELLKAKGTLETYDSVGTEILVYAIAKNYRVTVVSINAGTREGAPRFAGKLRANFLIGMALANGVWKFLAFKLQS